MHRRATQVLLPPGVGQRPGRPSVTSRAGLVAAAIVAALVATACAPALVGAGRVPAPEPGPRTSPGSVALRSPGPAPRCVQPSADGDFERVAPASVALDAEAVRGAVEYSSARGAQSVRVYRHDCLVATSGNDALVGGTPMATWSMTKGVVSMLVGRAVAQGSLSVDDPIGAHLGGLDAEHGAITVRQLLTQTSGLRFAWVNDLNAAGTGDSVAATLRRPFEHAPGTRFMYAQTTITVLVAVVEAAVGEDLQAYAARELFAPIGIPESHWRWDRDGAGRTQGFAFLDMSPEGFARLGSLLLAEGRWNDRQLIDASYIREGRRGTDANPSYGFLWRTNEGDRFPFFGYVEDDWLERRWLPPAPPDAFGLTGLFDQRLVVVPSLGLVVVRMGLPEDLFADPIGQVRGREPSGHHRFVEQLLGGVTDSTLVPQPWVPDPDLDWLDLEHLVGVGF